MLFILCMTYVSELSGFVASTLGRNAEKINIGSTIQHSVIRVDPVDRTRQKTCAWCKMLNIRTTKSGVTPRTYYQCNVCNVPLCINEKNCFSLYHQKIMGDNSSVVININEDI